MLATTALLASGCATSPATAPATPRQFSNPILPGFHPDPSICRVGDWFYLCTSSFEWFPGLPIHRSRDLVHWELVGHAIHRPGQLKALNLWAPTIRHHAGRFYVICTETPGTVFYVSAPSVEGPWSDAVYLPIDAKAVSAIDPSLFWDDDGTVWLTANDRVKSGSNRHWVWSQRIDLTPERATLLGERRYVTDGSHAGPDQFAEAPHLYRHGGYVHLLIAEGGTWAQHAVSSFRTRAMEGAVWEANPHNPILSHRGDPADPIAATGHADMVQTPRGDWWMVMLGTRPRDGKHRLGRETFLAPVQWQDGWPVVNAATGGRVRLRDTAPDLPEYPLPGLPATDFFTSSTLPLHWNQPLLPEQDPGWSLTEAPGRLRLRCRSRAPHENGPGGFLGRRQQHLAFDAHAVLSFAPQVSHEEAGLMARLHANHHIRLGLVGSPATLQLWRVEGPRRELLHEATWPHGTTACLAVQARDWDFRFLAGPAPDRLQYVGPVVDARNLSSEVGKGFTGSYVGVYATATGRASNAAADVHSFNYRPAPFVQGIDP